MKTLITFILFVLITACKIIELPQSNQHEEEKTENMGKGTTSENKVYICKSIPSLYHSTTECRLLLNTCKQEIEAVNTIGSKVPCHGCAGR